MSPVTRSGREVCRYFCTIEAPYRWKWVYLQIYLNLYVKQWATKIGWLLGKDASKRRRYSHIALCSLEPYHYYSYYYYYFNVDTVVLMLIIWLNELKWDSPGSCWHNDWLCGEAENVNDDEFWKALEFVNNKSSYSSKNLIICSQQQRKTQRPLFNKMIQKQDTRGIKGYLYWHNTASRLCP